MQVASRECDENVKDLRRERNQVGRLTIVTLLTESSITRIGIMSSDIVNPISRSKLDNALR